MRFRRTPLLLGVVVAISGALATDRVVAQQEPAGRGQAPAGRGQAPAGRGAAPTARGAARGRAANGPTAWFGVPTPPPFGKDPAVIVGDRGPHPVSLPAGEAANPEFIGTTIRADVKTIVGFSTESRTTKEIGSGQLWGRVTGLQSGWTTIDWAAEQFRKAGIADVKQQPIQVAPTARFWMPLSWEVRILADPAFGAGTQDIVLESAMPLSPSDIAGGTLTAPLVYVGTPSPAVLQHIDVKGKIAVQLVVPQGHMVFERGPVGAGADALVAKGAVGVLNLVRLPGNERSRDFSNCGNPCFNIGGRDGWFLENMLNKAAEANMSDKVRAQLTLKTEMRGDLKAQNVVAVIPGARADETMIIDAHVDAWFDGAGDNADGFAVMLALARHFAKPANKPQRTLVFIASAGHHSPGMNGPSGFMAANPALAQKAVLAINIEHVAQRNFSQARSTAPDGYRQAIADTGEAPIYAGVTNQSPFLNELIGQGVVRYGTNFVSEKSPMASGESGGFSRIEGPVVTFMQAPPLYHTTGEIESVISTPGLERMARFLSFFIVQADKTPRTQITPPGSLPANRGGGAGDTP